MESGLVNQLAYCTVRIECEIGEKQFSTGTGFFYNFCDGEKNVLPTIVTNKHVLEGAKKVKLMLTRMNQDKERLIGQNEMVEFEVGKDSRFNISLHPEGLDLAMITIGKFLLESEECGKRYFYKPVANDAIPPTNIRSDFSVMENVVMVGYPNSLFDNKNNMPIIRKGISATHPNLDYQGRAEFVVDIACFPGSSGSPVFLVNLGGYTDSRGNFYIGKHRIYLLGILYAGPQYNAQGEISVVPIPTSNIQISKTRIPMNLGYVINSSKLLSWESVIREMIN